MNVPGASLEFLMKMLKHEKTSYRRMWKRPEDYDDYWYFRKYWNENLPLLTRLQYLEFHTYLPNDILTKVDRVSMSVALEARVPLLATDIIQFSFSLPENVRYHCNELKGLLKQAYSNILPQVIINRKNRVSAFPPKVIILSSQKTAPARDSQTIWVYIIYRKCCK